MWTSNKILAGVLENTQPLYVDHRGYNMEICNTNFQDGWDTDTMSCSKRNVLRGLHGDFITDKLIQCLYGYIFLVVVDIRKESPTFLKHATFELFGTDGKQIYIPRGFLNGHVCLSEECIFFYKLSCPYNPNQITVAWDDPTLDIEWPIENPILSSRDRNADTLQIEDMYI